jgi:hypothetical protein
MHTCVVNRYKESYDVDIGRASRWGNPFSHDKKSKARFIVNSRDEAIDLYSYWILAQPELIHDLADLKGKKLGCFCLPSSCHGTFLAQLANNFDDKSEFNDDSAFW